MGSLDYLLHMEEDRHPSIPEKEFEFIEEEGNLFNAPDDALLMHSVNCLGAWGAGIARAFQRKYPAAFQVYNAHCRSFSEDPSNLLGTCLLIPPQGRDYSYKLGSDERCSHVDGDGDGEGRRTRRKIVVMKLRKRHWIACLFTSEGYGRKTKWKAGVDGPELILESTEKALKDLRRQLENLEGVGRDGGVEQQGESKRTDEEGSGPSSLAKPSGLYACRFNSGKFGVGWARTGRVVEEVFEGYGGLLRVVSPPEKRSVIRESDEQEEW